MNFPKKSQFGGRCCIISSQNFKHTSATHISISATIGLIFGCLNRKKSAKEYLMGGGDVSPFPIARDVLLAFEVLPKNRK